MCCLTLRKWWRSVGLFEDFCLWKSLFLFLISLFMGCVIHGRLFLVPRILLGTNLAIPLWITLLKELHRSSTDLEGWSFRSSSHLSLAKALKAVQSALRYRGMTRGTCFKIIGLNLTMQETMSWSDMPDRIVTLLTRESLFVRNRSRVLLFAEHFAGLLCFIYGGWKNHGFKN